MVSAAGPERHRSSDGSDPERLLLFLLFDAVRAPGRSSIQEDIARVEPLSSSVTCSALGADPEHPSLLISFEDHAFALVTIGTPVPADSAQQPVDMSNWSPEEKEPLRRHRAHMICAYTGTAIDPTEQFIAALKVAAALLPYGLVGVIDTAAWNCLPARALTVSLAPDFLSAARQAVPVAIWTGFLKFFRPDGRIWFCSKGFHRWGAPDFALLGEQGEGEVAVDIFSALLSYVRNTGARLSPGDTADLGGTLLRFGPVLEYAEYLASPTGTLVVERIDPPRR